LALLFVARVGLSVHPVVLVPGIMGTVLDATVKLDERPSLFCSKEETYSPFWIHPINMVDILDCYGDYFAPKFVVQKDSGEWVQDPGLQFSVPKQPKVYSVYQLLHWGIIDEVGYYDKVIEELIKYGYEDGENLISAGYNWMALPSDEWIENTRIRIETMVNKTDGKEKAVIIGHSMGCPFSYYFLMKMGDDWIKKYIHMYIPTAPAWMGALPPLSILFLSYYSRADFKRMDSVLEDFLSYFFDPNIYDILTNPLVFPVIKTALITAMASLGSKLRNIPTLWLLLPWKDAFPSDMILAYTPSKNYTFSELETLLRDKGFENYMQKLKSTQGLFSQWNNYDKVPPVPVKVFYGKNQPTIIGLNFSQDFKTFSTREPFESSDVTMSSTKSYGDGTVPLESLRYVSDKWKKKGADVEVFEDDEATHLGILQIDDIVQEIISQFCDDCEYDSTASFDVSESSTLIINVVLLLEMLIMFILI